MTDLLRFSNLPIPVPRLFFLFPTRTSKRVQSEALPLHQLNRFIFPSDMTCPFSSLQCDPAITSSFSVTTHSPLHGGDVVLYVKEINQPSLPTPFYSVLVSVSVFMALSTVFHSINSPHNSPLSHSVLLILIPSYWPFQLYLSMKVSLSPEIIFCG